VSAALKERYADDMSLSEAFAAALAALSAPGNGEYTAAQLEVAILDRARDHRTFRRIRGARLEELLAESRPAPEASAEDSGEAGDSGSSEDSGSGSAPGSSSASGSASGSASASGSSGSGPASSGAGSSGSGSASPSAGSTGPADSDPPTGPAPGGSDRGSGLGGGSPL
jgi:flagellar motor protein MotB